MRQIHDRQPVILDPAVYDAWLDPETPAAEVKNLLSRHLDSDLQFNRVSRTVNSVKNQGGDCIEPKKTGDCAGLGRRGLKGGRRSLGPSRGKAATTLSVVRSI